MSTPDEQGRGGTETVEELARRFQRLWDIRSTGGPTDAAQFYKLCDYEMPTLLAAIRAQATRIEQLEAVAMAAAVLREIERESIYTPKEQRNQVIAAEGILDNLLALATLEEQSKP